MMDSIEYAGNVLGKEITAVHADDGVVYVPLKALCECLGIDHDWQRAKVRNTKELMANLIPVSAADGRRRKTLCIPFEAVDVWLDTLNPGTVRPGAIEALEAYLEELDDAFEGWEIEEEDEGPSPEELVQTLVDSLIPALVGMIRFRSETLKREKEFIEDVAAESPAIRAKAQTYLELAEASYHTWLADFQKDMLRRLTLDSRAA